MFGFVRSCERNLKREPPYAETQLDFDSSEASCLALAPPALSAPPALPSRRSPGIFWPPFDFDRSFKLSEATNSKPMPSGCLPETASPVAEAQLDSEPIAETDEIVPVSKAYMLVVLVWECLVSVSVDFRSDGKQI